MYAIYANIWGILMVNVTIYSIHGSYGIWILLLYSYLPVTSLVLSKHLQKPSTLRSGKSVGRPSDLGTLPCTEISAGRRGLGQKAAGVPGMAWQMIRVGYPLVICYIAIENGDL